MNKVILMGRLVKDPETRYAQNNTLEICNFTLAVNRWRKSNDDNSADFIPVVTFGKQASLCREWLSKGRQVAVVGRIQVSSWETEPGRRQWKTEVIADEVHFADSKQASGNEYNNQPIQGEQNTGSNSNNNQKDDNISLMEEDDELPF